VLDRRNQLSKLGLRNVEEPLNLGLLLSSTVRDGHLELAAGGSWTALHANQLEPLIDDVELEASPGGPAAINMSQIEAFDTYGAWLLERLTRAWQARGWEMHVIELPVSYRRLFEEVRCTNREPQQGPPRVGSLVLGLEAVGDIADLGRDFVVFVNMLGALCHALVGLLLRPQSFRLTSAVPHLDRVAWQAVPIILLITFLIGGIISQQGSSADSLFLRSAISLQIARNSVWDFVLTKYSEPNCCTIYSSSWLIRILR
jgi:phospholipid/cholesterol/gamma-HCH transport system permease protein